MNEVCDLPVRYILPGNNDRKEFNFDEIEELAASIQANGLAQPITVRPLLWHCPSCQNRYTADLNNLDGPKQICTHCGYSVDLRFEIVAGERRFRAVMDVLGWKHIPSIIRDLTDEQASAIMLIENVQRVDLNPIEEAHAYQTRIERFGWSEKRVAEVASVPPERVKSRVSLLRLISQAQDLLKKGLISIGHAEAMAKLDDNRQIIAMKILTAGNPVAVGRFRSICAELLSEQDQEALFDIENFWVEQVQKKDSPRKGKHAHTGAPARDDLPPVELPDDNPHSAASIIDAYISKLIKQGYNNEAKTIGFVYNALVEMNYLAIPPNPKLLKLPENCQTIHSATFSGNSPETDCVTSYLSERVGFTDLG